MIEADEPRTAIRITKELSQFFRISISKGREYISIREEITHVELYIDIRRHGIPTVSSSPSMCPNP